MSEYDRPINYDRDVIMKYDRTQTDNENYINERANILNGKINNEYNIKLDQTEYNPLFTPENLIYNHLNEKKENYIKTAEFDPYLNYLKNKGLQEDGVKVRYNVEYINVDKEREAFNLKKLNNPEYLEKILRDIVNIELYFRKDDLITKKQ